MSTPPDDTTPRENDDPEENARIARLLDAFFRENPLHHPNNGSQPAVTGTNQPRVDRPLPPASEIPESVMILIRAMKRRSDAKHSKPDADDQEIAQMRRENEESARLGHRFSRDCGVCLEKVPRLRSVFNGCGHAVCRACAEKMKQDERQLRNRRSVICPLCRTTSMIIPLVEHLADESVPVEDKASNNASIGCQTEFTVKTRTMKRNERKRQIRKKKNSQPNA